MSFQAQISQIGIFFWVNRNRDLGTVPGYLFCETRTKKTKNIYKTNQNDTWALIYIYQQLEALLRSQAT